MYYGITLVVHVSVCLSIHCMFICPSIFSFPDDNRYSPNLVCALILWRFDLELVNGQIYQFLTFICLQMKLAGYYQFSFLYPATMVSRLTSVCRSYVCNTLALTFLKQSSWILLKMFVLLISRSFETGSLGVKN